MNLGLICIRFQHPPKLYYRNTYSFICSRICCAGSISLLLLCCRQYQFSSTDIQSTSFLVLSLNIQNDLILAVLRASSLLASLIRTFWNMLVSEIEDKSKTYDKIQFIQQQLFIKIIFIDSTYFCIKIMCTNNKLQKMKESIKENILYVQEVFSIFIHRVAI